MAKRKTVEDRRNEMVNKLAEEADAVLVLLTFQVEDHTTGVARTEVRFYQRGNECAIDGMIQRWDERDEEDEEEQDADADEDKAD